jgi:hypothetical protein
MNRKLPAHHLIISLCAASWLASSGALAQDNLTSTIAKAEQILLGSSQDTGTVEERLSAVEQKLYGKPRKGPLLKRMQAVAQMLRITPVPSPTPSAGGASAEGTDVRQTADKSAADSSATGNSAPTSTSAELPTTASSEPSRWDKPGTPPTSASYFPYKAESASQAESRQNAIRLGSDRKVVAIGQIPESGILVLNIETPIEGDLIGLSLYFEAATWSQSDMSDVEIAPMGSGFEALNMQFSGCETPAMRTKWFIQITVYLSIYP